MSASIYEELSPTDRQVIDQFQSAIDRLTQAGQLKLLSVLAGKCLSAEGGSLDLMNEAGDVFACLYSAERPTRDLKIDRSDEDLAAIKQNLFDPKKSRPWREVLAQLEAEDDRK